MSVTENESLILLVIISRSVRREEVDLVELDVFQRVRGARLRHHRA